ncbi:MAG: WD40 repeat domain-containing protein, partial [Bacteroidetes bacterium]|nr:WD40 repeat domain-containing protein [Bacteroidota bacterium]
AISASGEWVSAGNDKTAILWDETGKQIQVFKPQNPSQAPDIRSVDISADGQWILTGASNGEINLWQRGIDTAYYSYSTDGEVVDLSITGDGKTFVAAILNRNSMIFHFEEEKFTANILSEFHRDITAMKLLPDGSRLFTGDSKGSIQTWIPEDGTYDLRGTSYIHKGEITMINISPNGDWLLAASGDSTASVSSLHNRDLFKLYGHTGAVTSIFMNQDQTLITSSEDSTLKTWTTPFALYNQAFSYHRQGVNKVAFSPDQKFIASGGKDRRVVLTDILTGEKVWEHREHADPVKALNFRDTAVQSIDEYSNYIIFHPGQSTAQSIPLGERSLSAAVFSPDGQQVLTGGFDSLAQLWDVNQQTLLLELSLQSSIFSLAFAPDQSVFIIGCEDGKAYLFDPSGNQLQVFEGHQGGVTAVNFTPSSKKIITGSEDQRVILWNLSGQQLQQFRE